MTSVNVAPEVSWATYPDQLPDCSGVVARFIASIGDTICAGPTDGSAGGAAAFACGATTASAPAQNTAITAPRRPIEQRETRTNRSLPTVQPPQFAIGRARPYF